MLVLIIWFVGNNDSCVKFYPLYSIINLWIALFSRSSHLVFISSFSSPFIIILDKKIPIHPLQATPWYRTLVVLELQFYSFALSCFVGKLWWIGPLCSFSSLGTVSIMRCPTCHYWAFRLVPFPSTRLRVLITLSVLSALIIRSTVGSPTYQ
jgi:hypothetical protein